MCANQYNYRRRHTIYSHETEPKMSYRNLSSFHIFLSFICVLYTFYPTNRQNTEFFFFVFLIKKFTNHIYEITKGILILYLLRIFCLTTNQDTLSTWLNVVNYLHWDLCQIYSNEILFANEDLQNSNSKK